MSSLSGSKGDFGGDSVKILGTFLGDDSSIELELVSLLVFLDNLKLLELLESPSDDLSSSINVVRKTVPSVLSRSIEVCQKSDSSSGSDINLSGK